MIAEPQKPVDTHDIRAHYAANLRLGADDITDSWQRIEDGRGSPTDIAELERVCHKLAGSAGVFGYTLVSRYARAAEVALCELLNDGTRDNVGQMITRLIDAMMAIRIKD
ncbi:Hpt domain-containing protein [Parvularcula sp. LCG005]|uniref:Hpt domain-containing protein n=1 Tax=Parvularcula sp. LCG005 TaxID=3078805 RepID=UPI002942B857|nr:Hpt domain-containing protein [Parvularcula sp. LCG005]WOI54099.1 Hpt domain-containing protein [Parvularcula sp. LCG005]